MKPARIRIVNLVVNSGPGHVSSTPLGALTVAAAARGAGFDVIFDDYQFVPTADRWEPSAMAGFLGSCDVPILGISAYEHVLPHLVMAIRELRAGGFEGAIILGGPGPSSVADHLVARFPGIDAVVTGEGEEPIQRLLKVPKDRWALIEGVVTPTGATSRPRRRMGRPVLSPAYDLASRLGYDRFYLSTSRGCPYSCPYCTVPSQWGGEFSQRPTEDVLSDVRYLRQELGIRTIHIADDGFAASPRRARQIASALREVSSDIEWTSYVNLNRVSSDDLHALADQGCIGVFAGFESGSEALLNRLGRPADIRKMATAVSAVCDRVWTDCSLIWGYPDESMEDFRQTLMTAVWLSELSDKVQVRLFQLAPLASAALTKRSFDSLRFVRGETSAFTQTTPEQLPGHVADLVAEHPEVFSAYYRFYTPEAVRKRELLHRMYILGRGPER